MSLIKSPAPTPIEPGGTYSLLVPHHLSPLISVKRYLANILERLLTLVSD